MYLTLSQTCSNQLIQSKSELISVNMSYSPFLLLCWPESYGMDNHFSNLKLVHFLLYHLWVCLSKCFSLLYQRMVYLFMFVSFLCLAHCNTQLHLQCGWIWIWICNSKSCDYLIPIPGLYSSSSSCAHYRQHCLVEKPLSWSDAQHYCREEGFDLANVDSMGAMKALQPLIGNKCGARPPWW